MIKFIKLFYFTLFILSFQIPNLEAHNPPIPNFSATNLCYGDSSKFINQSTGGIYSMWIIQKWDTALNDTITLDSLYTTDLTYLFTSQGTYYITLQEDNGHLVEITREIIISNITKAGFSFQPCSNHFMNMSTCADSFLWDFGDGNSSIIPSATHQYADTGIYAVTLIVYKGTITDTLTQQIHITEIGYPKPIFQVTVSNDTAYCKITGGIYLINNLTWYYSDNTTATSADTFHVFQDTGTFYVNLRVINGCGVFMKDTTFNINYITSINEIRSIKPSCNIFPNPTHNILTIKTNKTDPIKSVSVFNLVGQKEIEIFDLDDNLMNMDLSQLQNGAYILCIKTGNNIFYSKIIKE